MSVTELTFRSVGLPREAAKPLVLTARELAKLNGVKVGEATEAEPMLRQACDNFDSLFNGAPQNGLLKIQVELFTRNLKTDVCYPFVELIKNGSQREIRTLGYEAIFSPGGITRGGSKIRSGRHNDPVYHPTQREANLIMLATRLSVEAFS
jgi:hypothetical protein